MQWLFLFSPSRLSLPIRGTQALFSLTVGVFVDWWRVDDPHCPPRSPLWPAVKHFASWLGLYPNWKKTGGKVKSSQTRKGKNRAAGTLRQAAWSLIRSKSNLGAHLRRQRSRLGAPKAITATAHKLARIYYTLMRYGLEYQKRSEEEFVFEHRQRTEKNLHRRAREFGYMLVPIPTVTPTPVQPTAA